MNVRNLFIRKAGARAQAAEFLNWGVYLVVLGLVLAFGSVIITGFTTGNALGSTCNGANVVISPGVCANPANNLQIGVFYASQGYNSIGYTNTALATIAQYLPDVALVVVASGMILLLVRGLVGAVSGGRGSQI